MKKLLSMLGVVTLAGTSIGSLPQVNNTNITNNSNFVIREKLIAPPRNSLLTTAGDSLTSRHEWSYVTINLGQLRQEQIVDIISTHSDSYTEHKVNGYGYHKIDKKAGINVGSNFRNYFYQGTAAGWNYKKAESKANSNFFSEVWWGLAWHRANGTMKYQWYYDANNNLLIDIVGTLFVSAGWSAEEGVASIKLGSMLTIKYTE